MRKGDKNVSSLYLCFYLFHFIYFRDSQKHQLKWQSVLERSNDREKGLEAGV